MKEKYFNFLRGVSVNWVGKLGVILTTSAFITFIALEIPRLAGLLTNAYLGLITYLLLPTLFFIGLALIPIAWFLYKKDTGKSTKELLNQQFSDSDLVAKHAGSRIFRIVVIFTIVNALFLSIASYRTVHFMDGAEFCGTACHSVMNPEWVAYQNSPHANVDCVECHVGEGTGAFINAKLNGAYQMLSLSLGLYERPIPTPVRQLRPARETCEKCHWPDKFYGTHLKSIVNYKPDSVSTPTYTTLNLKIDTGEKVGNNGIHWHIGKDNMVRYSSVDDSREEIIWVESKQADGTVRKYQNKNLVGSPEATSEVRVMDCVDCHNRATHIYQDPEKAVNKAIRSGEIDRSLPFVKKVALGAVYKTYPSHEVATAAIRNNVEGYYSKNYSNRVGEFNTRIEKTVNVLQKIHNENVFPSMKIEWGAYPNHIGHKANPGCFRCHNENMVGETEQAINHDCTLCHSILAYDSPEPFKFLKPEAKSGPDSTMHKYLQDEFLGSFSN